MSGWFGVGGSGAAGWFRAGPFACWRPFAGLRHGVPGQRQLRIGEQWNALCGARIAIRDVGEAEWFWPTCPECWLVATSAG